MSDENEVTRGSGNVFADLELPEPEEVRARADLLRLITRIIQHRHLTQSEAAELLGTNQPTVSDLMRGKLSRFSLERLIGYLTALGRDVEIVVRKKPRSRAAGRLAVADR
jgi:predicted XRE-type DNA-binding protein